MDFYNYFVFYFIRRFLNIFFNKKRLKKFAFFIIIFLVIIFILHTNGYCAFEPSDSGNLAYCRSYLSSIENYTRASYDYLGNIWVHANHLDSEMDSVLSKLDTAYQQETAMLDDLDDIEVLLTNIDTSTDNIESDVDDLLGEVQSLRVIITTQLNLINQMLGTINTTIQDESDETQDVISDGFSDLQELLTQYMFGSNYDSNTYSFMSNTSNYILDWGHGDMSYIRVGDSINYYWVIPDTFSRTFNFKVTFDGTNANPRNLGIRFGVSNVLPSSGNSAFVTNVHSLNQSNTGSYSFNSDILSGYKYFIISTNPGVSLTFTGDYNPVMEKGQTESIMDNQTENAEMINNSITDSNVEAPFNDLPTDTTQDITESGFTNVFDTIRTTFTTGIARDLVVPIPFTGKNFTINTGSVYGNANLGLVRTLISAFWYFLFSLFIAKDIAKKINMIKSGNLENIQSTNIKEDLL